VTLFLENRTIQLATGKYRWVAFAQPRQPVFGQRLKANLATAGDFWAGFA
jgi:hypothetical protein